MSRNVMVLLLVSGYVANAGGVMLTAYGQVGAGAALVALGTSLTSLARSPLVQGEAPKP